jgi:type IX secretion system PorP/SprF family membrane protein
MKRILLSLVVVVMGSGAMAQQDPQYSMFMFDKLSVNPGFAGMDGMYCGSAMYRNQYMGFVSGNPTQQFLLNLQGPVPVAYGGVGLTFYNDKIGFETNNIVRLSYSYHVPGHLTQSLSGTIGAGLSLGYASKSFNANWNPITQGDPNIPGSQDGAGAFDLGFGLYYKHSYNPNTYVGISSTHLNGADLEDIKMDVARHYWLMGGYGNNTLLSDFTLMGDFMMKTDFAVTQFDIAFRARYESLGDLKPWAGLSYRHKDGVNPMLGGLYQLPQKEGQCDEKYISAGLGYDVTLSNLSTVSNGTMEFFVKFCYKPCPQPPVVPILDVRYLGASRR